MVDTDRFQLGPELVHRVTTVSARIAETREGVVNPLQVSTHLPIDAESVGRVLESVGGETDLERVEIEGICYFRFDDPGEHVPDDMELAAEDHLDDRETLEDNLASLQSGDEQWTRKVREQHQLLQVAARAEEPTLGLSYFLAHSEVPSARVQSILNDFSAEGYVHHTFEGEGEEELEFTFPELEYPEERLERNLSLLEDLEGSEPSNPIWSLLGAFALLLLIVVLFIRFYTG